MVRVHNRSIKAAERMRRQKVRRKRRMLLFGLISACAVLALGIMLYSMHAYVKKFPQGQAGRNVYIGQIDVGGLDQAAVMQRMTANEQQMQNAVMTVKVGGKEAQLKLADLGLAYDRPEQAAAQAVSYGNEKNFVRRYFTLKKLGREPKVFAEKFRIDQKAAADLLSAQVDPLCSHAVDADITRTGSGFEITDEKAGHALNIEKTIQTISEHLHNDWDYRNFGIQAVQQKEEPQVTRSELATITDQLGTFSTDAGGGVRVQNIRTGAAKINGLVVRPGEEVSFTGKVVPFTEENGYVPAGSYEDGQVVDSYGGGICQVSTTLYNALLDSEIEIVKRYPHSMKVPYVKASRDAAIAEGHKDLIFKNNYETPIYIESLVRDDGALAISVYGKEVRTADRRVDYESETLDTEEYGVTYKTDASASLGSMSSGGNPHNGVTARLWKVVYEGEKEVSRDVINNSSYLKSDKIVRVGIRSSNSEAADLVAAAVGTQNSEKINAAISKARSLIAAESDKAEEKSQEEPEEETGESEEDG